MKTFTVTRPLWFSTFGNTNPTGVSGTASRSDIYAWDGTATDAGRSTSTEAPYNVPTSANLDGFSRVDATHFYASFTGTVTIPGRRKHPEQGRPLLERQPLGDVLRRQRRVGLERVPTSTRSASVGGSLYFSVSNTAVPPGAGGTGSSGTSTAGPVGRRSPGSSTAPRSVWVQPTSTASSTSEPTTGPSRSATRRRRSRASAPSPTRTSSAGRTARGASTSTARPTV